VSARARPQVRSAHRKADVLRRVNRFDGLANHPGCRAYVARATARPVGQSLSVFEEV
jgi:hypothetical protein